MTEAVTELMTELVTEVEVVMVVAMVVVVVVELVIKVRGNCWTGSPPTETGTVTGTYQTLAAPTLGAGMRAEVSCVLTCLTSGTGVGFGADRTSVTPTGAGESYRYRCKRELVYGRPEPAGTGNS